VERWPRGLAFIMAQPSDPVAPHGMLTASIRHGLCPWRPSSVLSNSRDWWSSALFLLPGPGQDRREEPPPAAPPSGPVDDGSFAGDDHAGAGRSSTANGNEDSFG